MNHRNVDELRLHLQTMMISFEFEIFHIHYECSKSYIHKSKYELSQS